jgi:serine/threonine-protein kinase
VAPELDTGDLFGAYRIGDLVGRGGMGVVRRAEHLHLGRTVALKLLAPELSGNAEFRDRFLRESRLAATLDHPNVVTVYDAGEVDGVLYLAMRFVTGTDLAALIARRGPLPPEDAVARLAQVGSALDAAHTAGLVHRDVKPANVMIDGDRCYLTDFGLTKQTTAPTVSGLTASGIFLGTVDYAAPEQIEGRAVDGRTDVYALGCVLHECLTASRPYPRDSQVAVLYAHLHEDPPRPSLLRPDLPPSLDDVVAKAMAKSPADRYATCAEMIAFARKAAYDERPTGITPPAPAPAPPAPTATPPERLTAAIPVTPTSPSPPPVETSRPPVSHVYSSGGGGGRGRAIALAGLLAVVVAIVAVVVIAGGGSDDGGGGGATTEASSGGAKATPDDAKSRDPSVVGKPIPVGNRPFGVVAGPGIVWVANNDDGTVTRAGADGAARTDIPTGEGPFGLARNKSSIWVANSDANTVSKIDVATGRAGDPISVGQKPYFLAVDDTSVFVSNGNAGTVTVLDASSGNRIGDDIAVGPGPRGIASNGSAVWVATMGDDSVSRIVGGTVVKKIKVGDNPAQLAFGGAALWVTNKDSGTVTRIAIGGGNDFKSKTIDVGKEPFGIAFGEGYVWVTLSGEDKVVRLDPKTGKVTGAPIPVPKQPVGVAVGGGSVWVTANDGNSLTRIDPGS